MFTSRMINTSFNNSGIKREFRLILQDELTTRCKRNPSYSLRSFAKFLEVSPSALSAMLNGKRPITHKMKIRLGLKLGLKLTDLEKLKSSPHGNSRLNIDSHNKIEFQQITLDTFSVISEPYHYALLELLKTQDFKWESRWISQRLKITVSEVNIAIDRLERIGLLERNSSGELVDATQGFSTDIREGLSSQAQRLFQQRSLQHAINSIESVPIEFRDNTSITMAIHKDDITKAKQMLKKFRRKFCEQLESSSNLDEVYQLTISFVPVTHFTGGKK